MKTAPIALLLLAGVALLPSSHAFLGFPGHRATGYVAQRLLTNNAHNRILAILNSGETLSSVSTFADEYLYQPGGGGGWSRTLHYVNQDPDWTCDYSPSFCERDFCLVSAITNYTSRLTADHGTQNFDLKMLVHFLGDFHTAPHFGFASDRGATQLKGRFFGKDRSIHQIWDRDMLDELLRRDFGRSEDRFYEHLLKSVRPGGLYYQESLEWKECSDRRPVSDCILDWAKYMAKMVCEKCYVHYDGTKIVNGFVFGENDFLARISDKQRMIAMAGVRMASVLNFVFDG